LVVLEDLDFDAQHLHMEPRLDSVREGCSTLSHSPNETTEDDYTV